MRNAWAAAKEVTFKVMDPNLFLVQFHCLGDWSRAIEGSPWLFRGAAIVMEEYDGFSNPRDYKLDRIPVWARIQGVPEGLMRKKELAEKVAKKVGDINTVVVNEGKINSTPYLRTRVWLDLSKPLVRVVLITIKERIKCMVQYEMLLNFCFFCGRIGHEVTEYGDGVHPKESCQWADWMRVPFSRMGTFREDHGGGRGRGRGRGRGHGGGRGSGMDIGDEDMRNSFDDEEDLTYLANKGIEPGGGGRVAKQVNLLETPPQANSSVSPLKEQEKKRPRREGGGEEDSATATIRSALSFEGSDRTQ